MSFEASNLELINGRQISFSLPTQQCLILQGESGVGKTLCLRALADLDPHEGQIQLDGMNQSATPPQQWRQQVQWVSAEPQWWEALVKEHFVQPPSSLLLKQLSLPEAILNQKIEQASVGQRQRLALLRSLSVNPQVLCLDEITANLDLNNTVKVENLLFSWLADSPNRYLIWVTHNAEQVNRIQQALPQQTQLYNMMPAVQ